MPVLPPDTPARGKYFNDPAEYLGVAVPSVCPNGYEPVFVGSQHDVVTEVSLDGCIFRVACHLIPIGGLFIYPVVFPLMIFFHGQIDIRCGAIIGIAVSSIVI